MLKAKVNPFDHSQLILTKDGTEVATADFVESGSLMGLRKVYKFQHVSIKTKDRAVGTEARSLLGSVVFMRDVDVMLMTAQRTTKQLEAIMSLTEKDSDIYSLLIEKFLNEGRVTFEAKDNKHAFKINEVSVGTVRTCASSVEVLVSFKREFRCLEPRWIERVTHEYKHYKSQQEES